jgi:DNA polymerase-3 subunit gamma/tau
MENFIVSARKYRPATFNTVVGQASITNTLKNAIKSNHLAQAFLFCGPRGVGKTTCARILAKTINCFNITENTEACNECESCKSFNSGASLNVYELDAASNNSVDDIRSLVDQVRFAPQLGDYKVYIIDEVHMLSQAAFNAFLKTLEEPPRHAIFILATTEKHKIIPTILSRCQIFDFNRIQIEDIAHHLAWIAKNENIVAEEDALHIIAQKADGALRDACSIFDQIVSFAGNTITYKAVIDNLNILDYDYYFKATDAILEGNIPSSLLLFNEILNNGFDGHNFITGLGEHFRNLLVCKDAATLQLLEVGANIRDKYREQAQKCSTSLLLRGLSLINKCDLSYKSSKNPRLQVELCLMQLCSLDSTAVGEKKNEQAVTVKPAAPATSTNTAPASQTANTAQPAQQKQPVNTAVTEPVKPQQPAPQQPVTQQKPVTPQQQPQTGARPVFKPTSPSISQFVKNEKKEENMANEPQGNYEQPREPFTAEALEEAWMKYAKQIQKDKAYLYATLTSRKHTLRDAVTIELVLENETAVERINEEKTELLTYLRKELRNFDINIVTPVDRTEGEKRVYTPQDKYRRMAELNPNINKLRQQFDLDIDF